MDASFYPILPSNVLFYELDSLLVYNLDVRNELNTQWKY